jgi:glutamate-1-semialdehyde 2,1-aminomutase
MSYQHRLNNLIPGGAHTYSRGFDQYPSNAPTILERGQGAYVWDPEGNKYLDYGMALRAVTIGYSDERVNAAAINEINKGNNLTRASVTELKAAELFTNTIPCAEMVKFAKNGSNTTTAAAKIARAFTGRQYICVPRQQPFFSFDDWFIGTTPMQKGVQRDHIMSTLLFDYNDINSLKLLFDQYPGQIAGVMLEPATSLTPCTKTCDIEFSSSSPCHTCPNKIKNFLHMVQNLCKKEGALFILDEMITGFRWALEGAHSYFDVQPDLITFGKGMANGFSVAAVSGSREIMKVGSIDIPGSERTFLLSTTHGGEMSGLGAFIETVNIYKKYNVCSHLWDFGHKLKAELNSISKENGLSEYFYIDGPAVGLNFVAKDTSGNLSTNFRTLFMQEMIKGGVLMPWISVSMAHGNREMDITLEAARAALKVYTNALQDGIGSFLIGQPIKPVFRKYN